MYCFEPLLSLLLLHSVRIIISTNKENNRLIKADISMAALLLVCLLFANDGQRNIFNPQSIANSELNRWQIHTVCGRNDMQHTTMVLHILWTHRVHHHHFIHIYHHSVDKLLMFNKLLAIRLTQSTLSFTLLSDPILTTLSFICLQKCYSQQYN